MQIRARENSRQRRRMHTMLFNVLHLAMMHMNTGNRVTPHNSSCCRTVTPVPLPVERICVFWWSNASVCPRLIKCRCQMRFAFRWMGMCLCVWDERGRESYMMSLDTFRVRSCSTDLRWYFRFVAAIVVVVVVVVVYVCKKLRLSVTDLTKFNQFAYVFIANEIDFSIVRGISCSFSSLLFVSSMHSNINGMWCSTSLHWKYWVVWKVMSVSFKNCLT